jgi:RES domain-containing protein
MASSERWITAYRIVAPHWAGSAFSGEGAAKFGGRWNPVGMPVVYLAGSRALAALEMLVHLTSPGSREKSYQMIEARIPADAILPVSNDGHPRMTGAHWLKSSRSLALQVPSFLIPEEPNYLVNPAHSEFFRLQVGKAAHFRFDPRM